MTYLLDVEGVFWDVRQPARESDHSVQFSNLILGGAVLSFPCLTSRHAQRQIYLCVSYISMGYTFYAICLLCNNPFLDQIDKSLKNQCIRQKTGAQNIVKEIKLYQKN